MTAVSKSIKEFILLLPPALICHLTRSTDGRRWRCGRGCGGGVEGGGAALKFKHVKTYKISVSWNYSSTFGFVILFYFIFKSFCIFLCSHKPQTHFHEYQLVLENYKHPGVWYYFWSMFFFLSLLFFLIEHFSAPELSSAQDGTKRRSPGCRTKNVSFKRKWKRKKHDVLICGTQATQRAIRLTSIFCRVGAVGNAA